MSWSPILEENYFWGALSTPGYPGQLSVLWHDDDAYVCDSQEVQRGFSKKAELWKHKSVEGKFPGWDVGRADFGRD